METCYNAFTRTVLHGITIRENRFGFKPEITAKTTKKKLRIYEVPILYYGRTHTNRAKKSAGRRRCAGHVVYFKVQSFVNIH